MRTISLSVAGILLILCFTGCPPVNSPRDPVYQELQTINRKLDESQKKQEQKLQELTISVNELAREITQTQKKDADNSYSYNQLLDELSILKQQLADSTQKFSELIDRVTFLQSSLDSLKIQGSLPSQSDQAGQSGTISVSPDTIYQTALTDYHKNNFDLAIQGFEQYIKSFPETNLAGNAQYWIGECYYSLNKFDRALQAFDMVLDKYTGNTKAPSAMLKKAFCYLEMGKIYDAKNQLTQVIERYPSSREMQLAQQKLRQLE